MYHKETNTYRATDITGSYDWIFEGIDFTPEYASMTDDDIKGWAMQIIEQSTENDIISVAEKADEEDWAEEKLESKIEEIKTDYEDEYESVEKAIREWMDAELKKLDELENKINDLVTEVNNVFTASEADKLFGKSGNTTASNCRRGVFRTARQSGATWLIHLSELRDYYNR